MKGCYMISYLAEASCVHFQVPTKFLFLKYYTVPFEMHWAEGMIPIKSI